MKVAILFGPPGSGKGTQGKLVSQELKIPHIATGDIMRDAVRRGTELGKKVEDYLTKGMLVPDEIVIRIIEERLKNDDTKNGFILDGFPRTIPQAEALEELFKKLGITKYKVIYIDVPDDEIVKRIAGRRTCPSCQRTYNIYFEPPKEDEICDLCGEKLYIREDDTEEKVKRRLDVYRENTLPLILYYEKKGVIVKVNGVGHINSIKREIIEKIENM